MYTWRITRYNPSFREKTGRYKGNEWTSFSDVGKFFNKKLTIDDYITVENTYIEAMVAFMDCAKIYSMKVTGLEKRSDQITTELNQDIYSEEMVNLFTVVHESDVLDLGKVKLLARLVLRENLWCKFETKKGMFVHFGYDYYMYIGCVKKCEDAICKTQSSGLFVEKYESPYSD